jgi:hypothetical protein
MALRGSVESTGRDRRRFLVSMVAVFVISLALRLLLLDNFRWENNYDSGLHGLLAQMLAAGYKPYAELFVSYPPLFVWSLQLPWLVWGRIEALQVVMIIYSLLGVLAVGFVAYRINGWLAGLLAASFLSLAGSYLAGSAQVMTEVPAISLATVAVAFSFAYYTGQRRPLLILASGLAMSASLMLKILMPFVLVLIPLIILLPELENKGKPLRSIVRSSVMNLLLLAAGLFVPVLVTFFLYDARAMYNQVIAFRLDSRLAYVDEWTQNQRAVWTFLFVDNLPIALSMIWGIVLLRKKQWDKTRLIWLWLLLSILFATVHVPLRLKHLPLVLPPFTVLAGIGLAEGWHRARRFYVPAPLLARALTVVTVLLTLYYAGALRSQFVAYAGPVAPDLRYETQTVVDRLLRFTSPADCIVTDYPNLAFFARRLVPPSLSEVSSTRLESGYLGSDDLIEATGAYSCQVVAPVAGRLEHNTPDFMDWTRDHFLAAWNYSQAEGKEVLLAQPLSDARPTYPLDVTFGGRLRLIGYDAQKTGWGQDPGLYLSLYWVVLKSTAQDYTIALRARSVDGTVVAADHQPYDGLVPMHLFPIGKTVKETMLMDRLPGPSGGKLALSSGLYVTDESGSSSFLAGPDGKDLVEIGMIESP